MGKRDKPDIRVEVVGEFTAEHAKRLQMVMYRVYKRVLTEQAEENQRSSNLTKPHMEHE